MKLPVLVAVLLVTHSAIQNQAKVTGSFSSQGARFEVAGAVAFNGTSAFDPDTPVVIVAISNVTLQSGAIGDFLDRKRAIEQLVKDDQTPVVYFEFTPQGKWRGLSYYFGPGNGCGYCTSDVTSTVRLANGRLTGKVTGTEKDRPFEVTLDAAVLTDDHGTALSANGGAPGAAYLAYHEALVSKNGKALKATLSPGNLTVFEGAQKDDDVAGYMSYLAGKHPLKRVKIVRGWSTSTKASLMIEGEDLTGKVTGEVLLLNVGGKWTVDEELTEMVIAATPE